MEDAMQYFLEKVSYLKFLLHSQWLRANRLDMHICHLISRKHLVKIAFAFVTLNSIANNMFCVV